MKNFMEFFTWDKIFNVAGFILKPLIILIMCKILIQTFTKIADKILEKTKLEKGIAGFLKSAINIILWCLTIIFIADSLGVNTASLVTILGVVSLALSLSFQNIMTNVFSGITILLSKPFSVGQYVQIGNICGTVREISLMRTTLVTPDNKIELIPNGDICQNPRAGPGLHPG